MKMNKLSFFLLTLFLVPQIFAQWRMGGGILDADKLPQGVSISPRGGTVIQGGAMAMAAFVAEEESVAKADEITPYIQSIAEALDNDPLTIYNWVRNTIHYVPYHGVRRGAHLTAVEKEGNDFDTATLLAALLRAAGHTDVRYEFGTVEISAAAAANWFGVSSEQVGKHLETAWGMYMEPGDVYESPTLVDGKIKFQHIWIVLDGQYKLDSSFKHYEKEGIQSLGGDAMGNDSNALLSKINFSGNSVLAAAGGNSINFEGLVDSYELNRTGVGAIKSQITSFTQNLISYIDNELEGAVSGSQLAGMRIIRREFNETLPVSLPSCFSNPTTQFSWAQIPKRYGVKLAISIGSINYECYTSELQGKKLGVWFRSNSKTAAAELWLDDAKLGMEFSEPPGGTPAQVVFTLSNELIPIQRNGTIVSEAITQTSKAASLPRGDAYIVSYGFGSTLGRLQDRQRLLADYTSQGDDPQGRRLLTENLYVMGLQYQNQLFQVNTIASNILDCIVHVNFHLGIAGRKGGPFVDLPYHYLAVTPKEFSSDNDSKEVKAFISSNYWMSALEHVAVEQIVEGAGVSTVKLLQFMAEEKGGPFYLVRSAAGSNKAAAYDKAVSLMANYTQTESGGGISVEEQKKIREAFIGEDNFGIALFCQENRMEYNYYVGTGYMLFSIQGNDWSSTMGISGGMNGGYGSFYNILSDTRYYQNIGTSIVSSSLFPTTCSVLTFADPIDMSNGSFYHNATDLSMGKDAPPFGLSFDRLYQSSRRAYDETGLGRGWTHNYNIKLSYRSPGDMDISRATAAEVAPLVVGIRAIYDIFDTYGQARQWVVPAMVACWLTEQLVDSRVSISMGDKNLEFTRNPDGSFAPPMGIVATLTGKKGEAHVLKFRKGLELGFRASDGQFLTITDRNNPEGIAQNLTATYGSSNLLSQVTDAYGRTLMFSYDSSKKLKSVSDSAGRVVKYTHADDRLGVVDPEGKEMTYFKDRKGRITKLVDALGRTVVSSTYDLFDRIVSQKMYGLDSHEWKLGFADGYTRSRDPMGGVEQHYFDSRGRRIEQIDALRNVARWEYDTLDRTTKIIFPEGDAISYVYNKYNEVIRETNAKGESRDIIPTDNESSEPAVEYDYQGLATNVEYYPFHKIKSITYPGGMVEKYEYDKRGRVSRLKSKNAAFWVTNNYVEPGSKWVQCIQTTGPRGTRYEYYNEIGQVTQTFTEDKYRSTFSYNRRGDLTKAVQWNARYTSEPDPAGVDPIPDGSIVTEITYDDCGEQETITTAGRTTRYAHDAQGNIVGVWRPDGKMATSQVYDRCNRLAASFDGLGRKTLFKYDETGKLRQSIDGLGRVTESFYDKNGRSTKAVSPRGHKTLTSYDVLGLPKEVEDPLKQKVKYQYDKNGRVVVLEDRRGHEYKIKYDDGNRTILRSTPMGRDSRSELNEEGLPFRSSSSSGKTITSTYNNATGELTREDIVADGSSERMEYVYSNGGAVIKITSTRISVGEDSKTGSVKMAYNSLGLVESYTYENNYTLRYKYNDSGGLSQIIYPGGEDVYYEYDENNHLKSIRDWRGGVTNYEYDAAGQMVKMVRPNGSQKRYVYDAGGQLCMTEDTGPNGGIISLQYMRFNKEGHDGNVRENDGEITWMMSYPSSIHSPIVAAGRGEYNADNQLSQWSRGNTSISVTHDLDGNMVTGPLANGEEGSYRYDLRNRLLSCDGVDYKYSPDGHRVGAGDISYVVDPVSGRVLEQRWRNAYTNGPTKKYFIWGPDLLYDRNAEGNGIYMYHTDYQGSIVAVSGWNGVVYGRTSYGSFGEVQGQTNTMKYLQPFGWLGGLGVMTDGNGLVYMKARYYNPAIRRFISEDPIGMEGGMNVYAYAGNNPIGYVDPEGTEKVTAGMNTAYTQWIQEGISNANFMRQQAEFWNENPLALGMRLVLPGVEALAQYQSGNYDAAVRSGFMDGVFLGASMVQGVGAIAKAGQTMSMAGNVAKSGVGLANAAGSKTVQLEFNFVKNLENPKFVIYKSAHLEANPGLLRYGEYTLNLPKLSTEKLNWAQNQQALQKAMNIGNPIRDISPNYGKGFLEKERDFLRSQGWGPIQQGGDVFWIKR